MKVGDLVRHRFSGMLAIVAGEKLRGPAPDGWVCVRWLDGFVSETSEEKLEVISES